ncbi:MAG: hypothetical protein P1V20_06585 [Verrucomicrobiales bacterium]|nr:hypothetical protein [Verrucomicrobiales bacterium]
MKIPILISLFAILLHLSVQAENTFRNWTNSEGRTITAELVELKGDNATLRMKNGRKYVVALSTLSEEDRQYSATWLEEKAAAEALSGVDTKLGVPTGTIVETTFDKDTPPTRKGDIAGWKAGIGEWQVADGSLIGNELPEDNHHSSLTYRFEATDLIITTTVMLGEATQIAIACRDTVPPNLHLGRLYITPDKLWIQRMSGIAKTTKAERLVTKEVNLKPDEWYDVTIEIIGDTYRAKVGKEELEASHSRFADAKGILALVNKGQGARFKDVAIRNAKPIE